MQISKISFKGDEDIFKKPDLSSKSWVNSKINPYDLQELYKYVTLEPLKDTFERINDDKRLSEDVSRITESSGEVVRTDISNPT